MHSFLRMRSALWAGFCALALSAIVAGAAEAKPRPGNPNKGFRLFARPLGALVINRIYCGLASTGEICVDSTNSSTIGGGFWPKGTADQYVFNSGIQVAGIIGADANPEWRGDTTGAQLFSPRGDSHGEEIRPIFNSSNPDDVANWPQAALVPTGDASEDLFNPLLRGRVSASQGDVWFLSWEGNPAFAAGREHPLGILVEQRGMGYNFPSGNQDILYFIYTFYNITATDPAAYAAVRPGMREILIEAASRFHTINEQTFSIDIPDAGYTISNFFAAFGADMDVAEAGANFASVNVPFSLGYTYEHTFSPASGWTFDPSIFSPPFFAGSGFVGVKYLKSPIDPVTGEEVGLTLFSNTINAGAFDDASNATQLWRYLSNNISVAAGDAACNTGDPRATRICYINNGQEDDMRFFQASGPLQLAPGAFGSIVVAYIFAAPRIVGACVGPGTCDLKPGDPTRLSDPIRLANEGVNAVDSVSGYVGFRGATPEGTVVQDSITTLPGSLLGKALVAQEVFRNQFLLPFAPEVPDFFLVPGNNEVTVLWRPSPSETTGDPFFAIANAPLTPEGAINPLFDPNYRQLDVEGYRVYRGRVDSPQSLQLLAQFDYAGTFIEDFGGQVNPTTGCAPELTPPIMTTCPAAFQPRTPGVAPTVSVEVALVGPIVQVAVPNRTALATGNAIVLAADTAITGAAGGCLGFGNAAECDLRDTGVPFVYVDRTARNNLRYFYSVTAFDINSLQSGPTSLESPRSTKSITPSATAANVDLAPAAEFSILGDDDNPVPAGTTPFAINASTGRFPGLPPHNMQIVGSIEQTVLALATPLSGTGITATIDSVKARFDSESYPDDGIATFSCLGRANAQGLCHEYFVTYAGPTGSVQTRTIVFVPVHSVFAEPIFRTAAITPGPVALDPQTEAQFGLPAGSSPPAAGFSVTVSRHGENSAGENFFGRRTGGAAAGAPIPMLNTSPGGSRWFEGANETLDDPAYAIRVGHLTGVDSIWAPLSHIDQDPVTPNPDPAAGAVQAPPGSVCMQMFNYLTSTFARQADIEVVWGAGGALASVRDLSTNVAVPFKPTPQSSYGFLTDNNGNGVVDWLDMTQVEEVTQAHIHSGFCGPANVATPVAIPAPGAGAALSQTAVSGPVSILAAGTAPAAHTQTGLGVGLYVAGHFHIFHLTGGVLPAEGTRWVLRSVTGPIRAATGPETTNPEGYTFVQRAGNPAVAGLRIRFVTASGTVVRAPSEADLAQVHTVPDPYYVTSAFEQTTDTKVIKFVNLPSQAIIRIYSSSGVLVDLVEHNSSTFGGSVDWDVRSRNNQVVASGVYFYHIESGGARRVGRFTVVNFAQ